MTGTTEVIYLEIIIHYPNCRQKATSFQDCSAIMCQLWENKYGSFNIQTVGKIRYICLEWLKKRENYFVTMVVGFTLRKGYVMGRNNKSSKYSHMVVTLASKCLKKLLPARNLIAAEYDTNVSTKWKHLAKSFGTEKNRSLKEGSSRLLIHYFCRVSSLIKQQPNTKQRVFSKHPLIMCIEYVLILNQVTLITQLHFSINIYKHEGKQRLKLDRKSRLCNMVSIKYWTYGNENKTKQCWKYYCAPV